MLFFPKEKIVSVVRQFLLSLHNRVEHNLKDFGATITKTTLHLITRYSFASQVSQQKQKPLFCYLLHSSLFFQPFWHFDIPLVAWRSWALCLVLPRNGTEQQYAWAFSLHSPPLHPLLSSELSIFQLWGVGASWPGEHRQQSQSQTMTSSLQDWQAMRDRCTLSSLHV